MTSSTRNSSVQATRKTARETAREVASETTCRTAHKATHKTSRKASSHSSESGATFCPVQKKCGGCQLLRIPYEKQLEQTQEEMFRLFKPFLNPHTIFSPISGMDEPFYYRNKVTSPYVPGKKLSSRSRKDKRADAQQANKRSSLRKNSNRAQGNGGHPDREILYGMYTAGTHRVIPTDTCLLENKTAKRIILAIKQIMQHYHMEPYNEDTGKGFMRHAVVRVGHSSNEILVTVVTNESAFPGSRNFCRELVKRVPDITTIVQNVNTRQTNVILGQEEKTLYGPGFILDKLCGLSFRISSHSFYQVNSTQTEVLYHYAIQMAQLTGTETVLDAYCGTGTIGLVAAKGLPETPEAHAAQVIGVDNIESAITDAYNNARHNGIENATFETADAGDFMKKQAKAGNRIDILLMDPPRAGASEDFLKATCLLAPKRIVYISCNPKTQQRDVEYLIKEGYYLNRVQPVDMFPHTNHTETVAVLSRKAATKTFIPVTVSPKDMGLDEAKAQPTYENIRKYVKETHGLTVSTLNIAQMKAECGLEMECDRSGGKQQPKCPPEKREAILDAFRHFGMIEDDSSEG